MVNMYGAPSAGNTQKNGIPALAFRNQCGRRGCGHIFEYEGPNPLGNIQRLVREHSPFCRGQRPEAAQILWGRSQNERESGQGEQEGDGWGQYDSTTAHRGGSSSPSSAGSTVDDSYIGLGEGGTWNTPSNSASSSSIGKKSSRSEAERRYALETDPWTTSVTPHEVVCRGCRRPIKLDRRSRYYPGLWEKHRDRERI
ncbi:hypothetical protein B0H13DRAFT_2017413 [Mycena leptocephala]|nr:hypothetical protein B0H13DRAFT_2017413 [Mycena leptocephala]